MCDKCYEILSDEQIYGIRLGQGENVKVFIGHEECLARIQQRLSEIYKIGDGSIDE